MQCPNCKGYMGLSDRVCQKCGQSLVTTSKAVTPPSPLAPQCVHCGTTNDTGAQACRYCGKDPSRRNVCPHCGKQLLGTARFCAACGKSVAAAAGRVIGGGVSRTPDFTRSGYGEKQPAGSFSTHMEPDRASIPPAPAVPSRSRDSQPANESFSRSQRQGEESENSADFSGRGFEEEEQSRQYHALAIGINSYLHIKNLKTAVGDAEEVARVLAEQYGFHTRLLLEKDATRDNIMKALNDYRKELGEHDSLLVYFAGHGHHDEKTDAAYWLPIDAEWDDTTRWVESTLIATQLKAMAARHVVIVSDSCFSGTMTRQGDISLSSGEGRANLLKKLFRKPARVLIASGGNEPVADNGADGHSIFADAFLKALRHPIKEPITAEELLVEQIKESVGGRSDQTPEYKVIRNSGHDHGDFVFPKRRAAVEFAGQRPAGDVSTQRGSFLQRFLRGKSPAESRYLGTWSFHVQVDGATQETRFSIALEPEARIVDPRTGKTVLGSWGEHDGDLVLALATKRAVLGFLGRVDGTGSAMLGSLHLDDGRPIGRWKAAKVAAGARVAAQDPDGLGSLISQFDRKSSGTRSGSFDLAGEIDKFFARTQIELKEIEYEFRYKNPHVQQNYVWQEKLEKTVLLIDWLRWDINAGAGALPRKDVELSDGKKLYRIAITGGYICFSFATATAFLGFRPGVGVLWDENQLRRVIQVAARHQGFGVDALTEVLTGSDDFEELGKTAFSLLYRLVGHELGHICYGHVHGTGYNQNTPATNHGGEYDADSFALAALGNAEDREQLWLSLIMLMVTQIAIQKLEGGDPSQAAHSHPAQVDRLVQMVMRFPELAEKYRIDAKWVNLKILELMQPPA